MIKFKQFLMFTTIFLVLLGSTHFATAADSVTFSLEFSNLANPGNDHYEGWLITSTEAVPAGKFTFDNSGNIVDLQGKSIDSFTISGVSLSDVTKYVLTQEPSGDTNTIPADIKPLAGDLNSAKTEADLSINLGVSLGSVSGSYLLATPSNGDNTNENAGIWFLDPTSGTPEASLVLPDLTNTAWIYEGWVVFDNVTAVTTGRFNKTTGVDSLDTFSGDQGYPPFPGEDYIQNAPAGLTFPADLNGSTIAITIEPKDDNSPDPYPLYPLKGFVPDDAVDHTLYNLDDTTASLPTGKVTFESNSSSGGLPGFLLLEILGVLMLAIPVIKYKNKRL